MRFYDGCKLVKTHPRGEPGSRSTDPRDFKDEARFATSQRDAAYFVARAREHGEAVGSYAEALLDSPLPWTRMRHAHALLRLARRYGSERVDLACRAALEEGLVDVVRLERIVTQGGPASGDEPPRGEVIPFPRFLRPAATYALKKSSDETKTTEGGSR